MPDFWFAPLRQEHFALLADWLARSHITTWWREEHDLASITARYGPVIGGSDPTEVFIALLASEPVGLIQWYRLDDNPDWKRVLGVFTDAEAAAGIDYLIANETHLGQGLGPAMIRQLLVEVWDRYLDIDKVITTTDERNRRSWRALEKCGFRRVYAGEIESDDPSDAGQSLVYTLLRSDLGVAG